MGLFLHADFFGVGLMCVHKPNALCEYPGKTNTGAGSGAGVSLLTKGWPFVKVPAPKHKSLEV